MFFKFLFFGIKNAKINFKNNKERGNLDMSKQERIRNRVWIIGIAVSLLVLMASTVSARSINLSEIGIVPWIVIILAVTLVLLQLIPAGIILFSTIGVISTAIFKRKKVTEEVGAEEGEAVSIPGYEPQLVKSEFEEA